MPILEQTRKDHPNLASVSMDQYLFGTNESMVALGFSYIESCLYRANTTRGYAVKPAVYIPNTETVSVHIYHTRGMRIGKKEGGGQINRREEEKLM